MSGSSSGSGVSGSDRGPQPTNADEALARLKSGNERFLRGEARFPTVQKDVLAELARGQQPYATILGYAATHLRTPLFVVMGHEGCGAVEAAVAWKFRGERQRSRIETLLENILPALDGLDQLLPPEALLRAAVEANVRWTIESILDSPEAKARAAEGVMKLVGAVFEIGTGRVRFLD
jgi:carbonic anhydrase